MAQGKTTLEHNCCIISSNLLDELDFVIGGYGSPTIEFIFNFNAFIEAYILSSYFIIGFAEKEQSEFGSKEFINNSTKFLDKLKNAKKVVVGVEIYQNGLRRWSSRAMF